MRRQEFLQTSPELALSVLQESRVGHLAFLRGNEVELLPYNFAYHQGQLYFHSSPKTGLAEACGQAVKFLAYHKLSWLPSTWKHPELACPATTYFCSLSLKANLQRVEERSEKATALEAFMQKYQEESYKPLVDKEYDKHLKALFVARLEVKDPIVKCKMGQHLTKNQREGVLEKLRFRAKPEDRGVAQLMRDMNAGLDDGEWREDLTLAQTEDLARQLSVTYWAEGRTSFQQRELNEQSNVLLAKCDGNKVLCFARVTNMSPSNGYLADVLVREGLRGQGLGRELMKKILEHPRIDRLRRVQLFTRDRQEFYNHFDFREYRREAGSSFMVREQAQGA